MNTPKELFLLFMKEHYQDSYGIRDNCGFAALDLVDFFKTHNISSERVQGHFLCDIPVHNKKDFTQEMKKDFLKSGLDFNSKEDRLEWIQNSVYREEWLRCPHYWVEVDGSIFDPSGEAQFIENNLSKDIDERRYLKD